jgi:uncharacterized protein with FMN-binding domain
MQDNKTKLIGLVVIVLLAAGGTAAVVFLNKPDDTSPSTNSTSAPETPTSNPVSSSYKDGTYSADGTYRSPGGTEEVGVTVTIKANVVTDVSIKTYGATGDSKQYQSMFKNGIGSLTVGKNINEINVSRVSGSSLTSTGFNSALETIKNEAKA